MNQSLYTPELRGQAYGATRVAANIRIRVRWVRNANVDFSRHNRLCGSPLIVFCGVIRCPQSVMINYTRAVNIKLVRCYVNVSLATGH